MLKYLRADLYKLFKSRTMWICYAACVVSFILFSSACYTLPDKDDTFAIITHIDCVITVMLEYQSVITYAILLSACLFLSKDYGAKFFKNLPDKGWAARLYQTLSKVICMIILIVIMYGLWLGINFVNAAARYYGEYGMGFFYGVEDLIDENSMPMFAINYTVNEWLKADGLYLLLAFAATMIIMAMAAVFRNGYAVTLTTLIWSIACPFVFEWIDPLYHDYKTLRHYTVFGGMLRTSDAIIFPKLERDMHVVDKMIAVSVIAIVVSLLVSWLVTWKREER